MKTSISLKESLLLAIALTLLSTLLVNITASLFGSWFAIRLATGGISLVYIIYLLSRSQSQTGRIAVTGIWGILTLTTMVLVDTPLVFIGIQVFAIWLIRSLYFYNSILSALGDLLLMSTSFMTAAWAWNMTHSLLISFWTLFLVQSLFVLIPEQFPSGLKRSSTQQPHTRDPFEHAHQAAENVLKNL